MEKQRWPMAVLVRAAKEPTVGGGGSEEAKKEVFQEGGLIAPLVETGGAVTAHCLSTGVFG